MSVRLVRFVLPCLLAMATSLVAQDPSGQGTGQSGTGQGGEGGQTRASKPPPAQPDPGSTLSPKEAQIKRLLKGGEGEEKPDGTEGTGDASAIAPPTVIVHSFVSHSGFTDPRRLAPGESGLAYLRVDIRSNAVVPATPLRLEYQPMQKVLSFGAQQIPQPRLRPTGKDHPVVAGFDDTFLIKVPISVDAGAKHGKYMFENLLVLTVIDTSSGLASPETKVPANFEVEVGPPMPRGVAVRPLMAVEAKPEGDARRWTPIATDQTQLGLSLALDGAGSVAPGESTALLARIVIPVHLSVPRSTLRIGLKNSLPGVQAGEPELPASEGSSSTWRGEAVVRLPLKILAKAEDGERVAHVQVQCAPIDGDGRPVPGSIDANVAFKVRRRVAAEVTVSAESGEPAGGVGDLQLGAGEKDQHVNWAIVGGAGGLVLLGVLAWLLRRR